MSDLVTQKIEALFASLNQPVFLLDKQGRCVVPRQVDTFMLPSSLQEGVPVSKSGYLFLTLPGFETRTLASKDGPQTKDILLLCAQMINLFRQEQGITRELGNALKRLAENELSAQELEILIHDHGIKPGLCRSAVLITLPRVSQGISQEMLADTIPLQEDDLLIPINRHSILLARCLVDEEQEDLKEYAMALLDTLQNELGLQAVIGLGQPIHKLEELSHSAHQARQALDIGSVFYPEAQVYLYKDLVLERFLLDCATEPAKQYIALLFNQDTEKLFSEEMLDTINVFINNSLNLTDAARELYIHRNTLVYRLDKIQKVSGLDLRHFKDAMLFKLLNDLRKREQSSQASR